MAGRLGVLATSAALFLCAACGEGAGTAAGRPGPGGERPAAVRVEAVRTGTIRGEVELVGELRAPEAVELAAEVGGRLTSVTAELGERVEQGALLATVDDREVRAQMAESRAAVEVAAASVRRAEAELRAVGVEVARKAPLAADDLVTRQDMDNLLARRETAEAALSVTKAQAFQAEARSRVLARQAASARVVAPFAGWVEARHLDPGAVVTPGKAILRLVRTDPVVARFRVTERHVGRLRTALSEGPVPVSVTVPAYPGQTFAGRLARIAPALDAESRSATAEAELPNDDGRLMPGMYCRIGLSLGGERRALLVPARAVRPGASDGTGPDSAAREPAVVVVEAGDVARLRRVTLGAEQGAEVEVLEGIAESDRVVVEGHARLRDGAKVRVLGEGGPGGDGGPERPGKGPGRGSPGR